MKCPFDDGFECKTVDELAYHLGEEHQGVEEAPTSITWKLAEIIAAEGETIPKSKIREKIKEFDHNANDDWITISTLSTILKQLLE